MRESESVKESARGTGSESETERETESGNVRENENESGTERGSARERGSEIGTERGRSLSAMAMWSTPPSGDLVQWLTSFLHTHTRVDA